MKAIAELATRNENSLVHHESIFDGVYHRITSKFNFCCENLDIDQVNIILKFERRCEQMDQYSLNTKFFFNSKTLINFR